MARNLNARTVHTGVNAERRQTSRPRPGVSLAERYTHVSPAPSAAGFRDITVYLRDGSFSSVRELESSITTFLALR
ncbi:hypothetical protein, partial [Pseudomonas syringae]